MPVIMPLIKQPSNFLTLPQLSSPQSLPAKVRIGAAVISILTVVGLTLLGSLTAHAAPTLTAPYKNKFIKDCKDYMSKQSGVCECVYQTLTKRYGGEKAFAAIDQKRVPTPDGYSGAVMSALFNCSDQN